MTAVPATLRSGPRAFLARAGALTGLALLAACGGPTSESEGPPPLLTTLPRALSPDESAIVAASNAFGLDLLRQVRAQDASPNIFLSPLSASMALGMAMNGAAGSTLDSMRLALRLGPAPLPAIDAGYRSLIDLLRGLDASSQFEIANSFWGHLGFPFKAAFLEAGRNWFDAEIRALDFTTPAALDAINQWASDKTHGKIPTILDEIQDDEIAFLLNAIYFKGSWRAAFDRSKTHPAVFHAGQGGDQSVPFMERPKAPLFYAETADAMVAELLYGNGAYAMTIVLPRPGKSLADVLAGLDAARWAEWIASLREAEREISLPKFRLDYKRSLADDLSALGMRIAFDQTGRADFSAMADLPPGVLFLTRVIQKTFVDVYEEGTEAAAVTVVGVGVTSVGPGPILVDRPFLFAIRERLSGTILFLGQLTRVP